MNYDKILSDFEKFMPIQPRMPSVLDGLALSRNLMGFNFIEPPPPRAKMTLSKYVLVSEEFRRETDAWLLEFFGHEDDFYKDKAFIFGSQYIMMRKPMFAAIVTNLGA